MTVYSFNLGIGWASSGVEYAQAYRANIFRKLHQPAKFIFTDLILNENIAHLTENIGFQDSEIIWLYTFFSDFEIAPSSYPLSQLEASFPFAASSVERSEKQVRYIFQSNNTIVTAYLKQGSSFVERVEYVSRGKLIRKDYYSYGRFLTEYYAPKDNRAHAYLRRFLNENGSVAFEEVTDDQGQAFYRFPDRIIDSKELLIQYFVSCLHLTADDSLIIDRSTGIGPSIMKAKGPAKVGVVIHADHFNAGSTNDDYVLWNNFYEFQFENAADTDFFITATAQQKKLLAKQFDQYMHTQPRIADIPVGSIDHLSYPTEARRPYSLMTASRIAGEKHIDWAVIAVSQAHEKIPQLTFDIYGKGGEEQRINKLIQKLGASDYIHLKGHVDLTNVYQHYGAYLSASTSEGFGLTLLEAIGSGLPIIGFDVRYGNQTFIKDQQNGYLIPSDRSEELHFNLDEMSDKIVQLFTKDDLKAFQQQSYDIAENFLTTKVEKKWQQLLEAIHD
ncbi:accessory Sec system glycosyltransferase GtfA [Oenococcus kitaharae]|uniref:UDP-N-acetylglucosamine--peptide N-acetylglucosaminyltransferase GtfA subunit n=1 Tax=Oenococcus kitaharae DSM 17330 TaxID=1045004 RepID=G9WHE3_9LACO|nr:accessory Sec system glycosyltransferase GtfA [Oenococcus kitaharae]EHN59935.1 GftA-like poly(glycerol-phosphate) alpha-glucosyltransferase [Oenococcus kitaharae DSM 17330]OEY82120.1 glycosyl transferase family 4 [Oenococcus kitaharae]OEY82425.1 glycosyl transferase family 4 [Oenococcus kitaharae]OEY83833.1 glycosyl transferase family 4 [Oenococcus kitaharae]